MYLFHLCVYVYVYIGVVADNQKLLLQSMSQPQDLPPVHYEPKKPNLTVYSGIGSCERRGVDEAFLLGYFLSFAFLFV